MAQGIGWTAQPGQKVPHGHSCRLGGQMHLHEASWGQEQKEPGGQHGWSDEPGGQ